MIRNHEQCVYSSTILTYWAVMTVPTFLIELLLSRVQESLAAKLECCEIHEKIWVFQETFFDFQHARRDPDELHKWSNKFGDIIGYCENRRNWEKWKRTTIAVNTLSCSQVRARQKSKRWKVSYVDDWPCGGCWDLYSRRDNSELSLPGDASARIPWPTEISDLDCEFPSRSLHKGS